MGIYMLLFMNNKTSDSLERKRNYKAVYIYIYIYCFPWFIIMTEGYVV